MDKKTKIFIFICLLILAPLLLSSCQKLKTSFKFVSAQAAYNQGKYDTAIKLYQELIEEKPDDFMLVWNLGITYYSKGDLYKSRKQAVKLRKMGQNDLADMLEQTIDKER